VPALAPPAAEECAGMGVSAVVWWARCRCRCIRRAGRRR
jgi:hypothetical protein